MISSIPFEITCSLQSLATYLQGSLLTPILLPTSLNGVACLLTTDLTNPQYYLNLQSTSVNIV